MKGIMKKVIEVIGIIIFIIVVFIIGVLFFMLFIPAVPNHYVNEVKTDGKIESQYLQMGHCKVASFKKDGSELIKKYYVYYPEELEYNNKKYPVIIVLNGTGILPKKYKALFKHLTSWGFVVIGNDDGNAGSGQSADESMNFIISENKNHKSVLYGKLDLDNIGITGHSQGGAGVLSAISIMEHKDKYKTAVVLSPTHEETAHQFGWNYDLTQIATPLLMIAGTEGEFETQAVIPLEKMSKMYNKITSSKVMLRRKGADHGQMLYSADGYVTAWFLYYLRSNTFASQAFIGDSPEIIENQLYQDQKIDLKRN